MKRPRRTTSGRRRRRLAIGVLSAAAIGALAGALAIGPLARAVVLAALRDLDPDARVDVRSVSPWRLELADVRLGDAAAGLEIARIEASYGPLDLLRGRIRHAVVYGATLRARVDEDGLDLGFGVGFDWGAGGGGGLDRIRDAIEVRGGRIDVALEGGTLTLPIASASLGPRGATIDIAGARYASADGSIDVGGSVTARLDASKSPGAISGSVTMSGARIGDVEAGPAGFRIGPGRSREPAFERGPDGSWRGAMSLMLEGGLEATWSG